MHKTGNLNEEGGGQMFSFKTVFYLKLLFATVIKIIANFAVFLNHIQETNK